MSSSYDIINGGKNSSPSTLKCVKYVVFVTLVVSIVVTSLSVISVIYVLKVNKKLKENEAPPSPTPSPTPIVSFTLPRKFVVDEKYILPPTDQQNLGTCWSFGTINNLESQYRGQGIDSGYLKPSEYVSFSEQAYFTLLGTECQKNATLKPCNYGGLRENSSEDQEAESIYYFYNQLPNLKNSIVPESVCPYRSLPSNLTNWSYFWCPDFDQYVKANPIRFTLKSISSAYTLAGAKELLFKVKRPIGIGTPLPALRYYVPCNGSRFSETDDCLNHSFECPEKAGTYCARVDIDARQRDGVFLDRSDVGNVAELGGHAMNVLGYNDDWVYRNRFQAKNNIPPMVGGLIVHNSWNYSGHSVEYWMDLISEENEAVQCPNHKVPFNWIPATYECLSQNQGDATQCSTDILRVRGHNYTHGADLLNCTRNGTICQSDKNYVLERFDGSYTSDVYVERLESGLDRIHLLEIDPSTKNITKINVSEVPFWILSSYFSPVNLVSNHPDQCGTWIIPYETLDAMLRLQWDFFDNFKVFDFEVEFEKTAYLNQADRSKYNYTYVELSTKIKQKINFDGPLPFDLIW